MLIYPDNNIFVDLHNKELTLRELTDSLQATNPTFLYSLAHLYEADTIRGYNGFTKENLVQQRLELITQITNGDYIRLVKGRRFARDKKTATDAYREITDFPSAEKIKQGFTGDMSFQLRNLFRETLKLDSRKLNNLAPAEVVTWLDNRYRAVGMEKSFNETVAMVLQRVKQQTGTVSLYDEIAVLFGLLDTVGYYRDKETDRSDYARMWDSNHAAYAAHTDLFLTDDMRTRKKTELVYHLLGIPTIVKALHP